MFDWLMKEKEKEMLKDAVDTKSHMDDAIRYAAMQRSILFMAEADLERQRQQQHQQEKAALESQLKAYAKMLGQAAGQNAQTATAAAINAYGNGVDQDMLDKFKEHESKKAPLDPIRAAIEGAVKELKHA